MLAKKNSLQLINQVDLSLTHTLVPLKDMSESHLRELLRDNQVQVVCAGDVLFERGAYDGQHIYLLHGDVALLDEHSLQTIVRGRSSTIPIAHRQPRALSAVAQTDCSLLRIDSERLDKMLAWSQVADYLQLNMARDSDFDEDIDWMMTVLKSNLFFKVPPINVETIFARLTTQVVDAGDVVIRQGELGDQCYFIKEGEADVWRHDESGRRLLATVGVGRCFGEDALVNDAPRNASIIMRTNGVLMRLDKHDFYRLLKEPQVASVGVEQIAEKIAQGAVVVDVRSEEEYSELHLQTAVNIPLNLLGMKSRLLGTYHTYLIYCNTGRRSRAAAYLLAQKGYHAIAIEEPQQLFTQSRWDVILDRHHNYVLRDGVAVLGV